MHYTLIHKDTLANSGASVGHGVKQSVLLAGGWDKLYAVAVLVIDGVSPKAELHEHDADVFRVISGTGTFILGGTLQNEERTAPGELVGDSILGGERCEVSVGDVLDIPPGVPHQFEVGAGRLELMIVKVCKANY